MIPIKKVKQIREDLGVPCIVIVTGDPDGEVIVATHGESKRNAGDAAFLGNEIKKYLGWPENLCNSKPLERICENCEFFRRGYHRPGNVIERNMHGNCLYEPQKVVRYEKDRACGHFEPNC